MGYYAELYFDWLEKLVMPEIHNYSLLLKYLYSIEFNVTNPNDQNRYMDGLYLRNRFIRDENIDEYEFNSYMDYRCNLLEMMAALSVRLEEDYMYDPSLGNRVSLWFSEMLYSLNLDVMTDDNFDIKYVRNHINIFNNHEYLPNGYGGLFCLVNNNIDMRKLPIWNQMLNWVKENS